MTYLVTGGTGLVGRQVVRLLSQEGEKVVNYDIAPLQESQEQIMNKDMSSRIEIVRGDVTDLALLIRTAQKYKVDRIIHLAACTSTGSEENPLLAVQVNCIGTLNILETARILSLKKVVWSSTGMLFGPPEWYEQEYISDDAPQYPPNIYAACKSFNEVATKQYFDKFGVDGIAIRFGKVYGAPWKEGGTYPPSGSTVITEELIVNPALGKPGKVPSGDATLNWLYVEDAARSVVMASRTATTKTRAFNINGDIRTMTEAVFSTIVHDQTPHPLDCEAVEANKLVFTSINVFWLDGPHILSSCSREVRLLSIDGLIFLAFCVSFSSLAAFALSSSCSPSADRNFGDMHD